MHEMIKKSIAHLLGSLSSRIFTGASSSMAFQKVPCPAILEHRPSITSELKWTVVLLISWHGEGREEGDINHALSRKSAYL